MKKPKTITCLNCGQKFTGKYCNQCSQPANTGKLTIRHTLSHFVTSYLSFEGKLWETLRDMTLRPGLVIRSYIEGKRQVYYKPAGFFIILTAFYLIIRGLINYDPLHGQFDHIDMSNPDEFQLKMQLTGKYMVEHINNILFLLVFSIGIMWSLFYRKRYNLAEMLTAGFYLVGYFISIGTLSMLFSNYSGIDVSKAQLAILFIYLFYAQVSTFGKGNLLRWLKYALVASLSILLYTNLGFLFGYMVVSITS